MFKTSLLLIAALVSSASVAEAQTSTKMYTNVRYGYSLCVPTQMRPAPAPANSDGRVFTSADGGRITVWGENNDLDQTLSGHFNDYPKANEHITYQVVRTTWAVQSGTSNWSVFWRKAYQRGDQFITVEVRYPASAKAVYDPYMKVMSQCFKVGLPAF